MEKKQENIKEINIQIGSRLRTIRQREKLSQEKFAERIGISRSFYQSAEKGKNTLNESTYIRVGKEFNVSIDYLIAGKINNSLECMEYVQSLNPLDKFETCMNMLLCICGESNNNFNEVLKLLLEDKGKIEYMQTTDKQILIVEDNKYSMDKICNIIDDIPDKVILKATTSDRAYKYAMEYDIDLFIIDIILDTSEVGDISGMDFAERIRTIEKYEMTPMIFTTSLEDPELHAYAYLHCYQYFEKPYDIGKFKEAVLKTLKSKSEKKEKEFYRIKTDGMVFPIKTNDIVYFDIKRSNLIIHCADRDEIAAPYRSSNQIMLELGSNRFLKCNNHIIINKDYIDVIDEAKRIVELKDGFGKVTVSIRMYKSFKEGLDT